MPYAIPLSHRGGEPVTFIELDKRIGWINDKLGFYEETIGGIVCNIPVEVMGQTVSAVTLADASHDDMVLGQNVVLTGNTVQGIMPDIQSATAGRRSYVGNASGGSVYVTVTDETNTKINGQGKRLLIEDGGFVILEEASNDNFIILRGCKVTLVPFA